MKLVLPLAALVCVVRCLPMSQDELEDFSNFLLKTSSLDIHVKSADADDAYDEDEVVSDHAWEESGKFEGDLILNDRQRRLIVENVEGLSRNGLTDSTKRWPNNEVIYFIQREHFNSGQMQAIQAGIDDLARASCVKFRPYRKGDRDAVVIQGSRRGCFSQVGYQGGYQVLNLSGRHPVGRGCFRHGTVVHELLHSLGFYHMQSSPDRDDYIDVVWANIVQPARHNFRKYNSFSVSDFGVGYDYDSVLHYSRRAFSANGQDTLVPKKSGAEIGQRIGLSDKDTQKLNKMYCDADNDAAIQADENVSKKQKNKKKKPKNPPFEGHGIGYHQGKTVVIKLPAAETYKLPNVPSTPVFDFSKTPEVVSPEAGGYRFGEEITYSYKPVTSANTGTSEDYGKPRIENTSKNTDIQLHDSKENNEPVKENKNSSQHPNDDISEPKHGPVYDYDKDLEEAFHRLTKIVKQRVYPQNSNHDNKDYTNSDLDDNFDKIVSHKPTEFQKPARTSEEKLGDDNKNQIQDKMDISYRTVVPTKRPYSSYEQTETPNYATLEYLKNRHDYSNIYAPKSPYDNSNVNENKERFKDDIRINPYKEGFYTDYVTKHKEHLAKDAQANKYSNVAKPIKYVIEENSKQDHNNDKLDSSYRIIFRTPKTYSAYEQTETPKYATLEYLKNRHDISDEYSPEKINNKNIKEKEPYTLEDLPTDSDWYTKDSYKNNPANYDLNSYSDYLQKKQNERQKDKEEHNKHAEDSKQDSLNKSKAEDGEKDKTKETSSEYEHPRYADDYNYYSRYQKADNFDHSDEDDSRESLNTPIAADSPKTGNYKQYPSYETYEKSESVEEQPNINGSESPKKTQAYKLYGEIVPTAKDWYKESYSIPDVSRAHGNNS